MLMELLTFLPGAKGAKPIERTLPHDSRDVFFFFLVFATDWESDADKGHGRICSKAFIRSKVLPSF